MPEMKLKNNKRSGLEPCALTTGIETPEAEMSGDQEMIWALDEIKKTQEEVRKIGRAQEEIQRMSRRIEAAQGGIETLQALRSGAIDKLDGLDICAEELGVEEQEEALGLRAEIQRVEEEIKRIEGLIREDASTINRAKEVIDKAQAEIQSPGKVLSEEHRQRLRELSEDWLRGLSVVLGCYGVLLPITAGSPTEASAHLLQGLCAWGALVPGGLG